jgi:hyaluronan synthase
MIELVIEAIFRSTYANFELVVVNDGSTDGTREILDELAKKHPEIKLIHKKNAGKRKAVGTGFTHCTGKHVVLIDSDSIVHHDAIMSLVEALESDPKIGAVVGNARAWNANKTWLTKFQSVWYDYSFNIHKSYESHFGLVQCCSGCMSAYRREAIIDFIPVWMDTDMLVGDDRQLTSLVHAKSWAKKELVFRFANKTFKSASRYDDAEDRLLTAQAMIQWKTVYAPAALVYTDVPETFRGYWKQQLRWRRGYLRVQFFVASFIWQNHPIVPFMFYTEFMSLLTMPLVLFTMFVYMPLIVGEPGYSIYFFVTNLAYAAAEGIDTRFRNKGDRNWKYRALVVIMLNFITGPLLIHALFTMKTNKWGTR